MKKKKVLQSALIVFTIIFLPVILNASELVISVVTGGSLSMESYNVPFNDAFHYGWMGTDSVVAFDFDYTTQRLHEILY